MCRIRNGKKRIALVLIDLYFRNSDGNCMISLV
nr:MAG TPA: HIRA B motif [Caudoviricetes sp.]